MFLSWEAMVQHTRLPIGMVRKCKDLEYKIRREEYQGNYAMQLRNSHQAVLELHFVFPSICMATMKRSNSTNISEDFSCFSKCTFC